MYIKKISVVKQLIILKQKLIDELLKESKQNFSSY